MSKRFSKFAAAVVIYASLAVYLYQPHFKHFNRLQYLLVFNVCLGALGCYVLSRRWVSTFAGSFFAGAIYGFGPFVLGLGSYHPTASSLAAAVPWLFLPATFAGTAFCKRKAKRQPKPKAKWRWLNVLLCALPFLAIAFFFQVSVHYRLFAIPTQAKLHPADLAGLLAPLVTANRSIPIIGFYHIPTVAFVMGLLMLLAARRFGAIYIFSLGTILAFCNSFFNISPIVWLAIPVLCCSVLAGAGIQGLASAGFADRKWVLVTALTMAVLSVVTLLLATKYFQVFAGLGTRHAKLLVEAAKMYILGALVVTTIFFMARARIRGLLIRQVILCSAMGLDIFIGARFIVDGLF